MMDEEVEQPLHKRQKMQLEQDEANGRDLEAEALEALRQSLEALREAGPISEHYAKMLSHLILLDHYHWISLHNKFLIYVL